MKILALHGFLGQGRDWGLLQTALEGSGIELVTPSLFDPESPVNFNSFDSLVETFLETTSGQNFDGLMGYSFGGRLSLEIIKRHPDFAKHIFILSSHLGGLTAEQAKEKQDFETSWSQRFLTESWSDVVADWNALPLFNTKEDIQRPQYEFDRRKLYLCLENLSVTSQGMFLDLPESLRGRIHFLVGEKDEKYASLYKSYQAAGWVKSFHSLSCAHRLHLEAPAEIASLLLELEIQ